MRGRAGLFLEAAAESSSITEVVMGLGYEPYGTDRPRALLRSEVDYSDL